MDRLSTRKEAPAESPEPCIDKIFTGGLDSEIDDPGIYRTGLVRIYTTPSMRRFNRSTLTLTLSSSSRPTLSDTVQWRQ